MLVGTVVQLKSILKEQITLVQIIIYVRAIIAKTTETKNVISIVQATLFETIHHKSQHKQKSIQTIKADITFTVFM